MSTQELIRRFQKDVAAYYIPEREIVQAGDLAGGAFSADPTFKYLMGNSSDSWFFHYYGI